MIRMINILLLAGCFCLFVSDVQAAEENTEKIAWRGVVEGFYGQPWSNQERAAQFSFYQQKGLNAYIYAPKDDPYHRSRWRDPYPPAELRELLALAQTANEHGVSFIFALSPGLDMHISGADEEKDLEALLAKFEQLYAGGIRGFAIFFDDIHNKDGAGQARILNAVESRFIAGKKDVLPLITVPTEYFTADMFQDGKMKPYTMSFSKNLHPDILVLYTGPGVVCDGIDQADIEKVQTVYGKRLGIWWNYPVNDYLLPKLALGPLTGMEGIANKKIPALFINPMEKAELSKISLATAADFAQNPAKYQEEVSWPAAIASQYGELAGAMEIFATHSQRMEKGWAHAGREDAPELRRKMNQLFEKLDKGEDISWEISCLQTEFSQMQEAGTRLQRELPEPIKQEANLQLRLFLQLAAADQTALQLLDAKAGRHKALYAALKKQLQKEVEQMPSVKQARISEKTAQAFIVRALKTEF